MWHPGRGNRALHVSLTSSLQGDTKYPCIVDVFRVSMGWLRAVARSPQLGLLATFRITTTADVIGLSILTPDTILVLDLSGDLRLLNVRALLQGIPLPLASETHHTVHESMEPAAKRPRYELGTMSASSMTTRPSIHTPRPPQLIPLSSLAHHLYNIPPNYFTPVFESLDAEVDVANGGLLIKVDSSTALDSPPRTMASSDSSCLKLWIGLSSHSILQLSLLPRRPTPTDLLMSSAASSDSLFSVSSACIFAPSGYQVPTSPHPLVSLTPLPKDLSLSSSPPQVPSLPSQSAPPLIPVAVVNLLSSLSSSSSTSSSTSSSLHDVSSTTNDTTSNMQTTHPCLLISTPDTVCVWIPHSTELAVDPITNTFSFSSSSSSTSTPLTYVKCNISTVFTQSTSLSFSSLSHPALFPSQSLQSSSLQTDYSPPIDPIITVSLWKSPPSSTSTTSSHSPAKPPPIILTIFTKRGRIIALIPGSSLRSSSSPSSTLSHANVTSSSSSSSYPSSSTSSTTPLSLFTAYSTLPSPLIAHLPPLSLWRNNIVFAGLSLLPFTFDVAQWIAVYASPPSSSHPNPQPTRSSIPEPYQDNPSSWPVVISVLEVPPSSSTSPPLFLLLVQTTGLWSSYPSTTGSHYLFAWSPLTSLFPPSEAPPSAPTHSAPSLPSHPILIRLNDYHSCPVSLLHCVSLAVPFPTPLSSSTQSHPSKDASASSLLLDPSITLSLLRSDHRTSLASPASSPSINVSSNQDPSLPLSKDGNTSPLNEYRAWQLRVQSLLDLIESVDSEVRRLNTVCPVVAQEPHSFPTATPSTTSTTSALSGLISKQNRLWSTDMPSTSMNDRLTSRISLSELSAALGTALRIARGQTYRYDITSLMSSYLSDHMRSQSTSSLHLAASLLLFSSISQHPLGKPHFSHLLPFIIGSSPSPPDYLINCHPSLVPDSLPQSLRSSWLAILSSIQSPSPLSGYPSSSSLPFSSTTPASALTSTLSTLVDVDFAYDVPFDPSDPSSSPLSSSLPSSLPLHPFPPTLYPPCPFPPTSDQYALSAPDRAFLSDRLDRIRYPFLRILLWHRPSASTSTPSSVLTTSSFPHHLYVRSYSSQSSPHDPPLKFPPYCTQLQVKLTLIHYPVTADPSFSPALQSQNIYHEDFLIPLPPNCESLPAGHALTLHVPLSPRLSSLLVTAQQGRISSPRTSMSSSSSPFIALLNCNVSLAFALPAQVSSPLSSTSALSSPSPSSLPSIPLASVSLDQLHFSFLSSQSSLKLSTTSPYTINKPVQSTSNNQPTSLTLRLPLPPVLSAPTALLRVAEHLLSLPSYPFGWTTTVSHLPPLPALSSHASSTSTSSSAPSQPQPSTSQLDPLTDFPPLTNSPCYRARLLQGQYAKALQEVMDDAHHRQQLILPPRQAGQHNVSSSSTAKAQTPSSPPKGPPPSISRVSLVFKPLSHFSHYPDEVDERNTILSTAPITVTLTLKRSNALSAQRTLPPAPSAPVTRLEHLPILHVSISSLHASPSLRIRSLIAMRLSTLLRIHSPPPVLSPLLSDSSALSTASPSLMSSRALRLSFETLLTLGHLAGVYKVERVNSKTSVSTDTTLDSSFADQIAIEPTSDSTQQFCRQLLPLTHSAVINTIASLPPVPHPLLSKLQKACPSLPSSPLKQTGHDSDAKMTDIALTNNDPTHSSSHSTDSHDATIPPTIINLSHERMLQLATAIASAARTDFSL